MNNDVLKHFGTVVDSNSQEQWLKVYEGQYDFRIVSPAGERYYSKGFDLNVVDIMCKSIDSYMAEFNLEWAA